MRFDCSQERFPATTMRLYVSPVGGPEAVEDLTMIEARDACKPTQLTLAEAEGYLQFDLWLGFQARNYATAFRSAISARRNARKGQSAPV